MTSLDPVPRPPLERGTALSTIYTTAEQQRQAAESLRRAAEDHALTVHAFVTAIANGEDPDPAPVLRSRGRVEALVEELLDEHTGEGDAFAELRVVLAELGQRRYHELDGDRGAPLIEGAFFTAIGLLLSGDDASRDLFHWWLCQAVPAAYVGRLPDHIWSGFWAWPARGEGHGLPARD